MDCLAAVRHMCSAAVPLLVVILSGFETKSVFELAACRISAVESDFAPVL